MASRAESIENVQIAISDTTEFLQDLPSHFSVGSDSKLHHDGRKANVFSSSNKLFADSYSEVLKVENREEFMLVKQRLLTLPIYMHVHLERHRRSGNTRIITHGDYVIMVNPKHPDISAQLQEKFEEAQQNLEMTDNFAIEVNFGPALRGWFASRFDGSWGNYISRNSSFCITNFSQRSKLCLNPVAWILCLPVCLVVAPLHCAYRAIMSKDSELKIRAAVQYVKGISPVQRAQIRNLVAAAYIQGLNSNLVNQQEDQRRYQEAYRQMPAPPQGYAKEMEQPPPSYESLSVPQTQQRDIDDEPAIQNIA